MPKRPNEVPIDLITERPLSKRTFSVMVRKLRELTEGTKLSRDYSMEMLAAEFNTPLGRKDRGDTVVGRRWAYPPQAVNNPIQYEVTTFGEEAWRRLRAADFTKDLLATVWFSSQLQTEDESNSFNFSLELLDEPRPFAFAGNLCGQIQLNEGLYNSEAQQLAVDAETIGALRVIEYYAGRESAEEPLDFRAEVTQEIGSDMVKAFGRLASIETLP